MDNSRFLKFTNITLGVMCGLLIALPVSFSLSNPIVGGLSVLILSALGGFSGYRRANSRAFMYFCIVAVGVLSSIITFSSNS
jgi:uncharacterized membrane protein